MDHTTKTLSKAIEKLLKNQIRDEAERSFLLNRLVPKNLGEYELTDIETLFFEKGVVDGSYEYSFEQNNVVGNCFRSEIFEWLVKLQIIDLRYIILTNQIIIKDAFFLRKDEYDNLDNLYASNKEADFRNSDPTKQEINQSLVQEITKFTLELSDTEIDIDLEFIDCVFKNGVNLNDASTYNLEFRNCDFGYAITDDSSDEKISLSAKHSKINGRLEFIGSSHYSDLKNKIAKIYNFYNKNDVSGKINLENVNIEKDLSFISLELDGEINCYSIRSHSVRIVQSYIYKPVTFSFSIISTYLAIDDSTIYIRDNSNHSVAVNAGGIRCNTVFLTNNLIIGQVNIHKSEVEIDLNCSGTTFISESMNKKREYSELWSDITLLIANSKIRNLYMTDGCQSFGMIDMTNLRAETVNFTKGFFMNYNSSHNNPYKVSIHAVAVNVTNFIVFNGLFSTEKVKLHNKIIETGRLNEYLSDDVWYVRQNIRESYLSKKIKEDLHFTESYSFKYLNELSQRAIIVGEARFENSYINGHFDCSGGLFYGMSPIIKDLNIHQNSLLNKFEKSIIYYFEIVVIVFCNLFIDLYNTLFFIFGSHVNYISFNKENLKSDDHEWNTALNLKYCRIDGNLFLNDGEKENNGETYQTNRIPFRACGVVDLHSSTIGQFFISPKRGIHEDNRWKVIGLKYEYIFSDSGQSDELVECNWFHPYADQENARQPLEALASALLRAGDDKKAREVLLKTSLFAQNDLESVFYRSLKRIATIGMPVYKAPIALCRLFVIGFCVYYCAYNTNLIRTKNDIYILTERNNGTVIEDSMTVNFSPTYYSFVNMLPINSNYKDNFIIDDRTILGKIVEGYSALHSLIGTLLLAMFILGLSRVTRKI